MKIDSIECIPVRVPIRPEVAIRAKGGTHSVSPFLLLKVHTNEGIVGLGEVSATPRWSGEDQVTAEHFIRTILGPAIIGEDPRNVELLSSRMRASIAGNAFTRAALEMALWDICGKAKGVPVYELLGGAVRESVTTKWSISGVEPERAAGIARWAAEQGFRTVKVKVGINPAEDVARVRAVRGELGESFRIGVDANGAWTPELAVEMIERLCEFGIYFAEQPVPPGDMAWLAEVRRRVKIPVLADESVYSPTDARAIVREGAADAISVYIGKAAGIGPAVQISAIAQAAHLGCTVGSNLELGVGTAAMLHLAVASSGITPEEFPCDIIGPLYYCDELLQEPLDLSNGRAIAPKGPGLGVELDEAKVRLYRVD